MSKKNVAAATENATVVEAAPINRVNEMQSQLVQIKNEHGSWNAVFRYLKSKGFSTSEIHRITGKRYQHVRNGLLMPVSNKATAKEA
ncbi:MAG: hypothetical protein E6Q97_36430 [Desulfurellales bacterium]|nr:MAG: hypothetical protein E6Q97_36430 [Desulfurellales bacterium]